VLFLGDVIRGCKKLTRASYFLGLELSCKNFLFSKILFTDYLKGFGYSWGLWDWAMLKLRAVDLILLVSSKSWRDVRDWGESTPLTGLAKPPLAAILARSELPKVSLASNWEFMSGLPEMGDWITMLSRNLLLSVRTHWSLSNTMTSFVVKPKSNTTCWPSYLMWCPIALAV